MIRDPAAAVNAAFTPPPNRTPLDHPPHVDPRRRWRCPTCGRLFRHPWLLVVHLVAAPTDPDRPGQGLGEVDAWTTAATVTAVDVAAASGMTPVAASGGR